MGLPAGSSPTRVAARALAIWFVLANLASPAPSEPGADVAAPLALIQTIPLPGVAGRCDHMTIDLAGGRLFLAALENKSVEVVDMKSGRRLRSLDRVGEPQGVAYLPWSRRLVVADGSGGVVHVFDDTLRQLPSIPLWGDADNIHLDTLKRRVYVGYGVGGIAVLDAAASHVIASLPLAGHPEGFVLASDGTRVFVNLPDHDRIVVLDRLRGRLLASWSLSPRSANFPIALDDNGQRLFVGCRRPMRVLVYDTRSGAPRAELPIAGDVDDLHWDAARKRLYVSCGEGAVEVFEQQPGGTIERRGRIETRAGARTSLFVPELDQLFVAIPTDGRAPAEIRVYAAKP